MNRNTAIYGYLDDSVCIEGSVTQTIFIDRANDEEGLLGFLLCSDGTIISVSYREMFWRFDVVQAGTAQFQKVEGIDEDDNCSDRITLKHPIGWVVFSKEVYRPYGLEESRGHAL